MIKALDFPIVLLVAALAAYILAGGLGLLVTGLLGFFWVGGPFRNIRHGPSSVMLPETIRKLRDLRTMPPAARPPQRFLIDLALCVALIVVGVIRLESKGLIGPIG